MLNTRGLIPDRRKESVKIFYYRKLSFHRSEILGIALDYDNVSFAFSVKDTLLMKNTINKGYSVFVVPYVKVLMNRSTLFLGP